MLLAPEVVLPLNSKTPLDKDDADLSAVWAALDSEQRQRLMESLAVTDTKHPWLGIAHRRDFVGAAPRRLGASIMPRPIIFDIDGTLTSTNEVDTRCYVQAMTQHLGIHIDSDWSRYRHVTDSGIATELLERQQRSLSEIASIRECFLQLLAEALQKAPQCCGEVPGAASFVKHLRGLPGVVLGLATGGWSVSAKAKLQHAGIDATGLAFASADDAEARIEIMSKCHDRILATALSLTDRPVYVGDGVWDAEAAQVLGWQFVGIGVGERAEQLRRCGVRTLFPDYRDVKAVLAALDVR
jgi:phosphoglycolate phosphatase-like HAD superfamily hydrolase